MLAVGVEGDDDLGARVDHQPVAGAQRRAAAAVDHVAGDHGAVLGGHVAGAVARAVVDDQHRGLHPADLGRHQVQHVADVLGLVVGGDEDRDLAAEARRAGRPGGTPPRRAPRARRRAGGSCAPACESARRIEQEEDEDREDGEAEDPPAVALLEGEGGEQLVGQLGAGDDRQANPGREQDQHVGVAQRAAADDRVGDDRDRDEQAGGAQRRQLGGEDACLGDHEPLEDRAAPALARAAAASGKISVIRISLRRGAASEAAPTAVTMTIGVAIATSSHHQRRQAEHAEAGQGQQDDQHLDDAPGGAFHRFADAAAPHPPDLAHGHRDVAERVFAEVLGEVLLADLAQRRVARQVGIASGDAVEERRRVDSFERLRSRRRGRGAGSAAPVSP